MENNIFFIFYLKYNIAADGRSRGIAKVVVQSPIDTETIIEELHGKELDGRKLEIARDRL